MVSISQVAAPTIQGLWHDGLGVGWGIKTRQKIWFTIMGAWSVWKSVIRRLRKNDQKARREMSLLAERR